MKRKEKIAAVLIIAMCFVVFGIFRIEGGRPKALLNHMSSSEQPQSKQLQVTDYAMGETFTVTREREVDETGTGDFLGSLELTVLEAAVYSSPQDAINTGAQSEDCLASSDNSDLFGSKDNKAVYLTYKVKVKNIDAYPTVVSKSSSTKRFFIDSIVSPQRVSGSMLEPIYCDPNLGGDSFGYIDLPRGQEMTITVGEALSASNFDTNECYLGGSETASTDFQVRLDVKDYRRDDNS